MAAADDHRAPHLPGRHAAPNPADVGIDPARLKVINLTPASRQDSDRAQAWLRGAMTALAVLAVAAAAVSWDAQYVLVRAVKHNTVIAALEAGIPDVGAVV